MVLSRSEKLVSALLILSPLLGIPFSIQHKRTTELLHAVCSEQYRNLEQARRAGNRRVIWEAQDLLTKCEARLRSGIVISKTS